MSQVISEGFIWLVWVSELTSVLLLGHQGRASGVGIGKTDKAELQTAVDDQILSPAGDLQHERATPLHSLHSKVTVTDSVHGVVQEVIEAKLLSHSLPVDLEGVTSKRTTAQRTTVNATDNLTKTLQLASERSSVRQHPVGPADRLGLLQVSVTRHQVLDFLLRTGNRDLNEVLELSIQLAQLITKPQAHVSSDLLVARAAGVQLSADLLADDLAQTALVCGVDVFVVGFGFEGVSAPFFGDLGEAALDFGELVLC